MADRQSWLILLPISAMLVLAGCAAQPFENAEANRAHERAMMEEIVRDYQTGRLTCEQFGSLVEMQIISWQADSIMEHTYR